MAAPTAIPGEALRFDNPAAPSYALAVDFYLPLR
jgi:hypothetical protein